MKNLVLRIAFVVIVVFALTVTAFAAPWDVQGHWAEEQITTLLNQDILRVYEDGQFKPNRAITRAEFAESLAKVLFLDQVTETDLTDIASHSAKGYIAALVKEGIVTGFPDHTFRPSDSLTRAQVVTMLSRALGLAEKAHQINMHNFASYLDMHDDHWANRYVKISTELSILNGYPDGTFRPNEETTRAQAAKMIEHFRTYNSATGFIADVYPSSNKMAITTLTGERIVLSIADSALIGRNNRLVPVTDFMKTDKVFVITDPSEKARYIKAYGLVTKADLTEEVSQRTNYIIEPFEVEALAKGDYQILKPKLFTEIQTRLVDYGLTPSEVESLMTQDWNSLEKQGKSRLTEAIAETTTLPLDMVSAMMSQDWEKVKALAKVEALNRAIRGVMNSDLLFNSDLIS